MNIKLFVIGLLFAACVTSLASAATPVGRYEGKYCKGAGDTAFLRLIDESFAFFHPSPLVPNVAMLYQPEWDTFAEGAGWGAWWIQNSYGFSYAATPFLQEPWASTLQRSWDMFWDNQGDGKRAGGGSWPSQLTSLVAPDGCLGDCATPDGIVYKQGDGDVNNHDWFYEATAAGVVMQAEILLANRDAEAIAHYLPKMARACDAVETTRDLKNNLFLVGPACNLLAPSYGGVKRPDGTFGKGYLAGLSITYAAALDRMVELYRLTDNQGRLAEYERRQKITRDSLAQLLTPTGYFIKSMEIDGTQHGVLGQARFGYLEGVANADAMGLRVADDATARSIYQTIKGFPAIRPFDFLMTNAPSLDDTYVNYGSTDFKEGFHQYGVWVNGGCWGTVEGRAILGYYRVGAFEDVRRSADRAMKWAKEFRMDDHLTQRGENTNNLWYDVAGKSLVTVSVDSFAIPAATIRGLFDYEYRSDRMVLRPRVPPSITEYVQKEPIRFGTKSLYISCRNGGSKVTSALVNGNPITLESPDTVVLMYEELPKRANIQIVTEGGWDAEPLPPTALPTPTATTIAAARQNALPVSLRTPHAMLKKLETLLAKEPNIAEADRASVRETIAAIEAWRKRTAIAPQGCFRPMTVEKRDLIIAFYENAAANMYNGFAKRMAVYAKSSDADKQHLSELFQQSQQ